MATAQTMVVLPSQGSANDVVNGVPGSMPRLVGHYLGRAAIVGLGIYAFAGERSARRAFVEGLAGSAAIEAFVLAWCWFHKDGA